jgi:Spy/CpxP family protein refolding chaperone
MMTSTAFAQPGGGNRPKKEKVEELKIAFITTELDLTSEEAQKFWPVYNELSEKLQAENRRQRQLRRDLMSNHATYTDAEFKAKSEAMLDSGVKEAQLRKEYYTKIAAAIGHKKATKLLSLEERFKKELLNRLNGQEGPGPGRPEGPQN